ncbi:small multidrug resistance protein [Anopheles sinensis]|uniref:Small multidrug resistance protein n=1 Tax=Anopheles sinensis TaxID=74873 RepID=A0A084W7V7_ANOSI|nr:small multidrug resistance protein [Anopheles sinensis]
MPCSSPHANSSGVSREGECEAPSRLRSTGLLVRWEGSWLGDAGGASAIYLLEQPLRTPPLGHFRSFSNTAQEGRRPTVYKCICLLLRTSVDAALVFDAFTSLATTPLLTPRVRIQRRQRYAWTFRSD